MAVNDIGAFHVIWSNFVVSCIQRCTLSSAAYDIRKQQLVTSKKFSCSRCGAPRGKLSETQAIAHGGLAFYLFPLLRQCHFQNGSLLPSKPRYVSFIIVSLCEILSHCGSCTADTFIEAHGSLLEPIPYHESLNVTLELSCSYAPSPC